MLIREKSNSHSTTTLQIRSCLRVPFNSMREKSKNIENPCLVQVLYIRMSSGIACCIVTISYNFEISVKLFIPRLNYSFDHRRFLRKKIVMYHGKLFFFSRKFISRIITRYALCPMDSSLESRRCKSYRLFANIDIL